MTKEDVWNLFKMTGNVKYYLKYKQMIMKTSWKNKVGRKTQND